MPTTTISLRADREYVKRIKKLAALQEKDMADVARDAFDSYFGPNVAALDTFLATTGVPDIELSSRKGTKKGVKHD